MSFKILNNPLLATIQDNGRFGLSHLGITNSGVMDLYSYNLANLLLENKNNTNILEIYYGNITLEATSKTVFTLTGAYCHCSVNDTKIDMYKTQTIQQGDILKIGSVKNALIVYLSVKNGFIIKKQLQSPSTTIKENIGGLDGTKLKKNDILPFTPTTIKSPKRFKSHLIPTYPKELELRVMLSYQENSFSQKEKEKFFSNQYFVSNEINRMGYKLEGEPIKSTLNGIISEGICFGSIQIPPDGKPIVLLKEHQTIGGYPKIGVVLDLDCYKLAQAKPGTKISFKKISFDEATKIKKNFLFTFNQ
jgi:biotin-dependent carboxylase-like uncharacterized protein